MPTRKSWALLAYLAMSDGREIPREELAGLLWPGSTERNARASLRQEIAVLRKVMASADLPAIESGKEQVRLDLLADTVDAHRMARLTQGGTPEDLRAAVACYAGEFLGGLIVAAHPFEDWLWVERQRLKAMVLTAYLQLLERDEAGPDAGRAIATASAMLTVDPTQEQAHRALMRIYRRLDRRAEALQQFQRCAGALQRELDTEPSRETVALAERIRADMETPAVGGAPSRGRPARARRLLQAIPAPAMDAPHMLIVLAASLDGIEALSPRLDPAELAAAQDQFAGRAGRHIAAHEGALISYGGDWLLACFGYPDPAETDAGRAVEAARAIAAEQVDMGGGNLLRVRTGLARGRVLIRRHASGEDRAEAVGIALRRAHNLAFAARGGDVVISADLSGRIGPGYDIGEFIASPPPRGREPGRGYLLRPLHTAGPGNGARPPAAG